MTELLSGGGRITKSSLIPFTSPGRSEPDVSACLTNKSSPIEVCFYCADQNPHRDRSRGITKYTLGLLAHLSRVPSVGLKAVVSESSFSVPDFIPRSNLPISTDHTIGRLVADHLHPLLMRSVKADIWHYPKGFLPLGGRVKARRVGTIADVMLQFDADHHPEARSQLAWTYWLAVLKHSVRDLDLILTVSEFSKHAILEFADRYSLKCPPIAVTYEGVEVLRSEEVVATEKKDSVVHLANKLSYKGTTWLLQQWLVLSESMPDLPKLLLVGELDERGQALLPKLTGVDLIPPLPRVELEQLIARSRALILPSEIEGFGIPVVEGYLLGTPVAYSKGTALEEIVGADSPGGFHRDVDSLRMALSEVLNMPREAIRKKGAELKARYSWSDCVQRTVDAYNTLL